MMDLSGHELRGTEESSRQARGGDCQARSRRPPRARSHAAPGTVGAGPEWVSCAGNVKHSPRVAADLLTGGAGLRIRPVEEERRAQPGTGHQPVFP